MDPRIAPVYAGLDNDPEFVALGYQDQFTVRARAAIKILGQDPEFLSLPPSDQQSVIEKYAAQTPALADKKLQAIVSMTVEKAKQGDPASVKAVSDLAAMNATGRGSVLYSIAAKLQQAASPVLGSPVGKALFGPTPGAAMAEEKMRQQMGGREAPPTSIMTGDDASKLQVYFGQLSEINPVFASVPKAQSTANIVGSLVDSLPFLMVPGAALESLGAKAAVSIAAQSASRVAVNLGRLALPALGFTLGGAVGNIARQNALAAIQSDPQMYSSTVKKIAQTASEGAAANFLFSIGIRGATEFIFPALKHLVRGPILETGISPKGSLWWKQATEPSVIDEAIRKSGGTYGVPEENLLAMHPYVRDMAWIRNYTVEAAARDASTVDLRPLDSLALASSDMPDMAFAPRTWAKPLEGPYTFWEMSAKDGKPQFLQTGSAENLGDLRSKLSDMAYSRYLRIDEASRPASMQASQGLIRQGEMQAVSARAYDPFPEKTVKGFITPNLRGHISPTEAQDAMSAAAEANGKAFHVKVKATPEMMSRIASNKSFLIDGAPLRLNIAAPEEANALAIITKPATRDMITEAEVFAAKSVKANSGWTFDEARKFYLIQKGFDGIVDTGSGVYETFFPSRMKWITDQVSKEGTLLPRSRAEFLAKSGPLGSQLVLQARIESSIGKEALASSPKALARVASAKFRGVMPSEDIKNFVSQIVDSKGIEASTVRVIKASGTVNKLSESEIMGLVKNPDGSIVVTIPEKIASVEAQKAFIEDMLGKLDGMSEAQVAKTGVGTFATLRSKNLADLIEKSPSRFALPFDNEAANRAWLSTIAYSEFGGSMIADLKAGGYALLDGSGKLQGTFKSLSEMSDKMLLSSLDARFIRSDLYRQGYKLTGKQGGTYTLAGAGLKTPLKGDLQTLLKEIDYRPSSISNRLAPRDIQITPDQTIATFNGKTLFASRKQAMQMLSKFENPDELAAMVKISHVEAGDVYQVAKGSFRVDVPSMGMTRYFEDAKAAKAFLESDFKDLEVLKDAANSKGLSFFYDYKTGGYTISDGATLVKASGPEQAQTILKGYPDTPGAREILSALDPQADEAVRQAIALVDPEMMAKWKASDFDRNLVRWDSSILEETPLPGPQGLASGVRHSIRDFSSSLDYWIESTVDRQLGLKDFGQRLRLAKRAAETSYGASEESKRVLEAVFSDERGKLMKLKRRQAIVAYKEAIGVPEALPRAKATFGELTPHEQMRLGQLGKLTDAWFGRFGVESSTYIKGYVSHMREWALTHWNQASTLVDADEMMSLAYKGEANIPKKLKAMFHNERAQTLLDATMEDDPIKIFSRYVDQGNREFYMKQPFEDVLTYMRKNWDGIPQDVKSHALVSLKMVAGFHEIEGMMKAENLLSSIHQAAEKIPIVKKLLRPTDASTGSKMFKTLMGMTYLKTIAFRPWVAARNMLQPPQMLAGRVGLEPVFSGMKRFLKASPAEILELRMNNLLMKDIPVTAKLNNNGPAAKLLRTGMRTTWAADDFTRGSAAFTAYGLVDEGIASWNRGVFKGDIQKFIDFTELRSIQKTSGPLVDQITKLALSGDAASVKEAKLLFAKKLSDETMVDYSLYSQASMYTQNLPGYIFGRFGSFSTAYRENIYRGWTNAQGIAGKALFISRFVGTNLAIYEALKAMGINGKDFIPGYGGLFGGGPQFSTALAAFQSPSSGSLGQQARYGLEKEFSPVVVSEAANPDQRVRANYPGFLPGSLHAYYFKKMKDYLDQGDYWKAFLAGSSVPTLK